MGDIGVADRVKQIKLIVNPNSQRMKVTLFLQSIVTRFEKGGCKVDVYKTLGGGDATDVAREAAKSGDYEVVVAGGGDGTVNEVLNGLMPNPIKMGILPLGTSNGLARELNIPLNPFRAVDAILNGHSTQIDVGIANGRYFGIMVGCGFDAYAIEKTNLRFKRFAGKYSYVFAAIKSLYRYKSNRIRLVVDGQPLDEDAVFVVVSNAQLYGGRYRLTPNASVDDGMLDVFVYKGRSIYRFLYLAIKMLMQRQLDSSDTVCLRAKNLLLYAKDRVPYQADGDALGELPVQIHILPLALEIVGTGTAEDAESIKSN
jgi:diacylglycerol kinase (ATP)